jgi:DUF971 family protein/molybdopterin converting factor small subunit
MSEHEHPVPTEINLHRKSRILAVTFSDGASFRFPCEYLRVHSRAAEEVTSDAPVVGRENVNIDHIEPQGNYAIRIVFDDGHDTTAFSWETLYDLGVNQEKYWQEYLARVKSTGYQREHDEPGPTTSEEMTLEVLYFNYLVNKLGKQQEQVKVPRKLAPDVQSFLEVLARRKLDRGYLLAPDTVRVTVNRQFAEPFTRLEDGDEVGIVPNSPTPPPPPKD